MVREGFSEGLVRSWSLSLEKVFAKVQRHENCSGVWEGWLVTACSEMRPQVWAAEERAGHEGQLRQALGDFQTLPHCSQTAPTPGVPPPVCFFMNQSFEAPAPGGRDQARRKSWVPCSEGSWAEGWVWLSVGKAQSDSVTAGWGLGVLVAREAAAQGHTAFGAGLPLQDLLVPPSPHLSVLRACAGSSVPEPSRSSCCRRGIRQAGRKGFLVEEGFW